MHLVRDRRLGVPQESREAFDLLEQVAHLDDFLAFTSVVLRPAPR
jgi:hypothetical protein